MVKRTRVPKLMIMARLAAMIIVFILGHYALLAMDPHGTDTDITSASISHHSAMVEQCGSTDITVQQPGSPLTISQVAAIPVIGALAVLHAPCRSIITSVAPAPDASIIRLSYQVFLN